MLFTKFYVFPVREYDYFTGDNTEYKKFDNLSECFHAWLISKNSDFDYCDHFRQTEEIYSYVKYEVEKQPKHGHVFGHKPTDEDICNWKMNCFDGDMLEHGYWLHRMYDMSDHTFADEVEFPVFGWDGEQVETFKCIPNGYLSAWFQSTYGWDFNGEAFGDFEDIGLISRGLAEVEVEELHDKASCDLFDNVPMLYEDDIDFDAPSDDTLLGVSTTGIRKVNIVRPVPVKKTAAKKLVVIPVELKNTIRNAFYGKTRHISLFVDDGLMTENNMIAKSEHCDSIYYVKYSLGTIKATLNSLKNELGITSWNESEKRDGVHAWLY